MSLIIFPGLMLLVFLMSLSVSINKGRVRVAVPTFPKSAYRLEETASGIVEINEWASRARIKVNSPDYVV